jgi:hypothetical protein
MSRKEDREGLSIWYRLWYRVKYTAWYVMGPAQLGEADDPHARMRRRREAKVAEARAARLAREGGTGG